MIFPYGIRVRFEENFSSDGFNLWIREKNPDGIVSYAEPIVMKTRKEMELDPGPAIKFSHETIQDLFEQLWVMGFRPKNQEEAVGELRATKFHLEDMRKTNEYLLRKTDEFIKVLTDV